MIEIWSSTRLISSCLRSTWQIDRFSDRKLDYSEWDGKSQRSIVISPPLPVQALLVLVYETPIYEVFSD